jgi:transcriptional regulator with XRE-family HTH domain
MATREFHYVLDPDSLALTDALVRPFAPSYAGGFGSVSVRVRAGAAANRDFVVSVVEPDPEEERDAIEQLDGETLAAWHRSAPRRALSSALRGMRMARGRSQAEVAAAMGVTQSDVARMESATGPWPNQAKLAAYAEACGMKAVIGFIEAGSPDAASTMSIVPLGGTFGERPEETLAAGDLDAAQQSREKLYE